MAYMHAPLFCRPLGQCFNHRAFSASGNCRRDTKTGSTGSTWLPFNRAQLWRQSVPLPCPPVSPPGSGQPPSSAVISQARLGGAGTDWIAFSSRIFVHVRWDQIQTRFCFLQCWFKSDKNSCYEGHNGSLFTLLRPLMVLSSVPQAGLEGELMNQNCFPQSIFSFHNASRWVSTNNLTLTEGTWDVPGTPSPSFYLVSFLI